MNQSKEKDKEISKNNVNLSGLNIGSPIDIKFNKINNINKYSVEKNDKPVQNISNNKERNERKNINEKVDPFDFDFMLNRNHVLRERNDKYNDKPKKDDISDLINYQDSEINIDNFDYLNIKNHYHNNNNIRKKSPNKLVNNDNSNIENIISTPNISKKPQPLNNQYSNIRNINSYNKQASIINSNISKDNIKYRINNVHNNQKSYSRPESAKVPTSIKVSKKILDNQSNRRVSPLKNMNLAMDYNNQKNYNINDLLMKNKPRNLTPLKPIEGYKSPIINKNIENQYIRKNVIPSLNNVPTNPTPVRVRPLSGVNPSIGRINNYNLKNPNILLANNNRNELPVNQYNKRNFTPTPSNIKSHRIELDANRRNYGIIISNNIIENKIRGENNYNKAANVYSNRNNNVNDKYKLNENMNLDRINKTPLPSAKILNNNMDHDFNNFYNQGKILQNNYNMKIQKANLIKNSNNDYINNLYSNIYAAREKNNFPSNISQGNRVLSGRK